MLSMDTNYNPKDDLKTFFRLLNMVEESDSGNTFRPTYICSSRAADMNKINEALSRLEDWAEHGSNPPTEDSTVSDFIETEIVLVETVSMFRMRYAVRVPVGKAAWALDSVVMNEIERELGQKHLDETIVSHRVISAAETAELFFEDNDYLRNSPGVEPLDYVYDTTAGANEEPWQPGEGNE